MPATPTKPHPRPTQPPAPFPAPAPRSGNPLPVSGTDTKKRKASDRSVVWILIDRSGSMQGLESAVVKGVSDFIKDQASGPGKCRLTVAQFDSSDPFEVLIDAAPVGKAATGALDQYQPRHMTPLFDAIGHLIARTDKRAKARKKAGKSPEDQTVVIVTDGRENASSDYTAATIHELIEKRRKKGWEFVFMGANQDSYAEGAKMGFSGGNTQNYLATPEGVTAAFSSISRSYSTRRSMSAEQRSATSGDYFGGVREAEDDMAASSA